MYRNNTYKSHTKQSVISENLIITNTLTRTEICDFLVHKLSKFCCNSQNEIQALSNLFLTLIVYINV